MIFKEEAPNRAVWRTRLEEAMGHPKTGYVMMIMMMMIPTLQFSNF
jgi:hypothetical protein